jgi:CDP-paratose 2-epimerase
MSLRELLAYLKAELKVEIPLRWSDWRPGDQPVFACNFGKAQRLHSWQPTINVQNGVRQLIHWVRDNAELFASLK